MIRDDNALVPGLTRKAVVVQLGRLLVKQHRDSAEFVHEGFFQVRDSFWKNSCPGPSIPEESHIVM